MKATLLVFICIVFVLLNTVVVTGHECPTNQVLVPNTVTCVCKDNFSGVDCKECAPGFRMYPDCFPIKLSGYVGCFSAIADAVNPQLSFASGNMYVQKCQNLCLLHNKTYAITKSAARCVCVDDFGDFGLQVKDELCNLRCTGDEFQICGAHTLGSVYYSDPIGISEPPKIISLIPTKLNVEQSTLITITGKYLLSVKQTDATTVVTAANVVIFNPTYISSEFPCRIRMNSATKIVCEVQPNVGGNIEVKIFTNQHGPASSYNGLSYASPNISQITPVAARIGDSVTILGSLFPSDVLLFEAIKKYSTVLFNGFSIPIKTINMNQIVFVVPILSKDSYANNNVIMVDIGEQKSNAMNLSILGCSNKITCNDKGVCEDAILPICKCITGFSGPFCNTSLPPKCNNNSSCDLKTESCLNCPNDCKSCYFNGGKLSQYPCLNMHDCEPEITSIISSGMTNFMSDYLLPISATITGYFKAPTSGTYFFRVTGTNIGGKLTFNNNNKPAANAYFAAEEFEIFGNIILAAGTTNKFVLSLVSDIITTDRSFNMSWKLPNEAEKPFTEFFFSQHRCDDDIHDEGENCANIAQVNSTKSIEEFCGDGLCTESDPNTCLADCHYVITPRCPPLSTPGQHLPVFWVGSDTLSELIENQFLYHLPGIEYMQYGVDITTGLDGTSPIFYFGYCDSKIQNIVQDVYRGFVYNIPNEVSAVALPRCTYSTETTSFSTSEQLKEDIASSATFEVSAELGGGTHFVSASAKAAYSQSNSVKKSRELEKRQSGSITKTEVKCSTSKVELTKITFHPLFLKDIASINKDSDVIELVKKYGTHYYRGALLGGKLEQLSSTESLYENSASQQELQESNNLAFSASVSSPIFGASGSYSESSDSNVNAERQSAFESSSSRTTITTLGGAPGAYGPGIDSGPSSFGDWARTVDVLPVPIESTLARIANIIPATWKTLNGSSIATLWSNAELEFYQSVIEVTYNNPMDMTHYRLDWYFDNIEIVSHYNYRLIVTFTNKLSIEIDLYDSDPSIGVLAPLMFNENAMFNSPSPLTASFIGPAGVIESAAILSVVGPLYHSDVGEKFAIYDTSQGTQFYVNKVYPPNPEIIIIYLKIKSLSNSPGIFNIVLYGTLTQEQVFCIKSKSSTCCKNLDSQICFEANWHPKAGEHFELQISKKSEILGAIRAIEFSIGTKAPDFDFGTGTQTTESTIQVTEVLAIQTILDVRRVVAIFTPFELNTSSNTTFYSPVTSIRNYQF